MQQSLKILLEKDVRGIFDSFTRLMNIRIVFLTPQGTEIEAGDNRQRCGYCTTVRQNFGYENACRTTDMKMAVQSQQTKRLICYKCHAGLVEAVKPIIINDNCLGYIMIGQIRTEQSLTASTDFLKGLPAKEFAALKKEFRNVPYYEAQNINDVLRLFEMITDFIISHRLIAIHNADPVEVIKEYINDNISDFLTLEAAASMVHKSVSSISHSFKEKTGLGLIQYQIQTKLEHAKKMLLKTSVKNAAIETGFSDPLYFSRLFKKKCGISPTEYRNTFPVRPKQGAKPPQ